MVDLAIVQQLTIEARVNGLDEASAKFDKLSAATQTTSLKSEILHKQMTLVESSITRVGSKLESYTRAHDPLAKALADVERGERLVAAARSRGLDVTTTHLGAVEKARDRYKALSEGLNDNSRATGLNRNQQLELMHVSKALADEFAASGVSLRAFAMEGGRIGEIFASGSGGVGGTLKAIGGMIAPVVLNPLTLLTVGFGAAGYAAFQFSEQQERLERSLNGVGRAAGVNADQLRSIGVSSARSGGLGAGQGIELAGQYASAGISGPNISTLIGDTQRFSDAFGLDIEKASDEVTRIVSDAGLGAFEKRFGAASFSTKELVRSLEASGRYIEAETEKTRLFDEQVKKATDTTWSIAKAWDSVKASISDATQSLGRFAEKKINGPSLQDQLGAARGDYFFLNAQRRGDASSYPGEDAARRRVEELERQIEEERKKTADAARDLDLNRRSQRAGSIVDEMTPDASRYRGLLEKHDALKPFVESEEALKKLGDRAGDARATFDQLSYQLTHFQTAVQRIAEDSALATRQTEAWTFAERASVAADKAFTEAIRDNKTVLEAAASAESARNAIIAEGNKKAGDLNKAADDRLALQGLSPFAASQKAIDQKYRDLKEQYTPEKGDLAPYAAPAISAFIRAKDSVNALADAASHAAGALGGKGSSSLPIFAQGSGSDVANYIRSAAGARGIDPDIALRVARSEGLNSYVGDGGSSFGPFQLHYGNVASGGNRVGGLGDVFTQQTGLDARDPSTVQRQIDFSLDQAARGGWGPWHGAAKVGIGNFDGIGGRGSNDNVPTLKSISGAGFDSGNAKEKAADLYDKSIAKINAENTALASQNAMLDSSSASWGKSTYEMGRAAEEQKLINEFTAQGVPLTESLRAQIAQTADGYGKLATRLEEADQAHKKLVGSMDELRSTSRDALGTFVGDLRQGKSAADSLKDSVSHIADKLIGLAEDQLISGLFGKQGKAGGGIFGDALGGIFGNIGHMFGFADGGIMTSRGPLPLNRYADGGIASSPQLAMFGEGRGPEAFVPLKGGAIPVSIRGPAPLGSGSGSASSGAKVVVHNYAAGIEVTPQITKGEVHMIVKSVVAENNVRQSQADKRSA